MWPTKQWTWDFYLSPSPTVFVHEMDTVVGGQGEFSRDLLTNSKGFTKETTVSTEQASRREKAGSYAFDDSIWVLMSQTLSNQTQRLIPALHLLLDQGNEQSASQQSWLTADTGRASLSGRVMRADKWAFILDHSCWQGCRFGVATTVG